MGVYFPIILESISQQLPALEHQFDIIGEGITVPYVELDGLRINELLQNRVQVLRVANPMNYAVCGRNRNGCHTLIRDLV